MMEIKIKEAYDTLKEVIADISRVIQSLSQWEERQLIDKYRNGLGAINLICLKVMAEADVAQRVGKNISLTLEDRREIVCSIIGLGQKLAKIFEFPSLSSFLGKNSHLAYEMCKKMYGEREDYTPQDIWSDEAEFLLWIRNIQSDIDNVFRELDRV